MKKLVSLCLALAMLFMLAACSSSAPTGGSIPAPRDTPSQGGSSGAGSGGEVIVPVGAILSQTGGGASPGINMKNGYEYAIEVVNANGGLTIDGVTYKFKLVSYDDGTVAADAVSACQRLLEEDGVTNIIFGCTTSTATLACLEILEPAGVPIMTNCSAPVFTSGEYDVTLRSKSGTTDQARLMAQYFRGHLGCQTVAIVANNDDWGRAGVEDLQREWTALGGEVVSVQYIDPGATDFTTELTNVKAANPDFVYNISLKAAGSIVAKQYDEMGIDAYYATSDDAINDYTVGDYMYYNAAVYTDEMKAVEEAILAKGQECTIFALLGYDGFMEIFQAMEEAGTVYDGKAIIEALKASDGSKYTCMGKDFVYDEYGQIRMHLYLIQQTAADGSYKPVWCTPPEGDGYEM